MLPAHTILTISLLISIHVFSLYRNARMIFQMMLSTTRLNPKSRIRMQMHQFPKKPMIEK